MRQLAFSYAQAHSVKRWAVYEHERRHNEHRRVGNVCGMRWRSHSQINNVAEMASLASEKNISYNELNEKKFANNFLNK